MKRDTRYIIIILLLVTASLSAQDRVPRPDFESGYVFPELQTPPSRSLILEYTDVGVLALCLAAASYFVLIRRSRIGIIALSLFSIAYFGFFREGCICPVGSIQNVALALADRSYPIPVYAAAVFLLPLLTTIFAGRVFCSSVCPLGAIQDLVVLRPLQIPRWLDKPLGFFPFIYLGLAVLFAATGSDFIICRFDPFVSIYRLGGSFPILLLGGVFLLSGTVIARPYCRYLCPYGALLRVFSSLSVKHATITPDSCIQCGLCKEACPVGAIEAPTGDLEPAHAIVEKRRLLIFVALVPLVLAAGWTGGRMASDILARMHPEVRLAERIVAEDSGTVEGSTLESETFLASDSTKEELFAAASVVKRAFVSGSPFLGLFVVMALCATIASTFTRSLSTDYTIRRSACVSCSRCFSYCPREHLRRAPDTRGAESRGSKR